jgi:hypothetical protein
VLWKTDLPCRSSPGRRKFLRYYSVWFAIYVKAGGLLIRLFRIAMLATARADKAQHRGATALVVTNS